MRKEKKEVAVEPSIAFSRFGTTQVLVTTVSLKDMMAAKTEALLNRRESRDAFDIEFLIKKGIDLPVKDTGEKLRQVIYSFNKNDYAVKRGSLLESQERKYYTGENFKVLLGLLCIK